MCAGLNIPRLPHATGISNPCLATCKPLSLHCFHSWLPPKALIFSLPCFSLSTLLSCSGSNPFNMVMSMCVSVSTPMNVSSDKQELAGLLRHCSSWHAHRVHHDVWQMSHWATCCELGGSSEAYAVLPPPGIMDEPQPPLFWLSLSLIAFINDIMKPEWSALSLLSTRRGYPATIKERWDI